MNQSSERSRARRDGAVPFQHVLGFTSDPIAGDALLSVRTFGATPIHPARPHDRSFRAYLSREPIGESMAWFRPNDPTRRKPNAGMLLYPWTADVVVDSGAAFVALRDAVADAGVADAFLHSLAQDVAGETDFLAVSSASGRRVYISGAEIFRFYYGTSSRLARAILNGGVLNTKQEIVSSFSPATEASGGIAHLVLPRSVLPSDVPTIARWVLAQQKMGLQYATDVYRHSVASRPIAGLRRLRARPPFHGMSRLAGWALFDHEDPRSVAFVFGLHQCSAQYPFERLHWRYNRDLRESSDGESTRPSQSPPGRGRSGLRREPEPLSFLYLDEDATPTTRFSTQTVQVDDLARRFPGLALHGVERTARTMGPVDASAPSGAFVLRQPLGHSARAPSSQGDRGVQGVDLTVGDANAKESIRGRPVGPDPDRILRRTLDIGQRLAELTGARLHNRVVTPASAEALGHTFNVFPATLEGKRWRWLYLDDARTHVRPLLLLEFEHGTRWGYLIDVVRRAVEPMALLLVRTDTGERVSDDALGQLVSLMARQRVRGNAIGAEHGKALGLAIAPRIHRLSMSIDPAVREYASVLFPPNAAPP